MEGVEKRVESGWVAAILKSVSFDMCRRHCRPLAFQLNFDPFAPLIKSTGIEFNVKFIEMSPWCIF